MDREDDWLLEERTARDNASVEKNRGACVELQEPGVSHFATQEEDMFLTFMPSPPPTTFEAATVGRSARWLSIRRRRKPQYQTTARIWTLRHTTRRCRQMRPQNPPTISPKHIRARTDVGRPLESLQGKELRRVTGQMGLTLACTPDEKERPS